MGSISGKNGSTTFAPPNKRSSAPTRSNLTGKNGIWSPPREHTRRGNVRFHRRPPRMFMAYAMNARVLHQFGTKANVLRLLINAVQQQPLKERDVTALASQERRRVVDEVSRWSRDAGFNRRVLFAYGNRCAVTRVQLRLVDAAHILPVGAPDSVDLVQNGIALAPTYHRAFDAGLIYLDEQYRMRINHGRLQFLQGLNLAGGIEAFRAPLGEIFLPPDPAQRPRVEFIRKANALRQIPT